MLFISTDVSHSNSECTTNCSDLLQYKIATRSGWYGFVHTHTYNGMTFPHHPWISAMLMGQISLIICHNMVSCRIFSILILSEVLQAKWKSSICILKINFSIKNGKEIFLWTFLVFIHNKKICSQKTLTRRSVSDIAFLDRLKRTQDSNVVVLLGRLESKKKFWGSRAGAKDKKIGNSSNGVSTKSHEVSFRKKLYVQKKRTPKKGAHKPVQPKHINSP